MHVSSPHAGWSTPALLRYWADVAWRTVATMDTLRERARVMREHEAAGMPPLLHFEAEQVADGRDGHPRSNYQLLRITRCGSDHLEQHVLPGAAPVLVVDPRAGHGPGIGGFRRDSEVGMALVEGHPVYFAVFDPEPVEGQTMGAVVETLARFIDLVANRHPGTEPIVYGNCQGGWAVAMALSHCNRRAGLAVLNGSPLSYWAGENDVNPLRLMGAFTGGAWLAHWVADVGAGRFDGAWLVQNFELLRPEGLWRKYDTLFANPEREHDRFLEFERWWNGFYFLGREEILVIVRELFIGNRLENGEVVIDGHCHANLARVRTPLVVFSSHGDNITPPHQALGWLQAVYPSTQALVDAGQRIVYLLHQDVGHLGIFVSADVAKREHRAILHHAAAIQALPPGLYEMCLGNKVRDGAVPAAEFVPRRVEELPFEPPGPGFEAVSRLSNQLDDLYTALVSPVVRLWATRQGAWLMEQWHPMRTSRRCWSEEVVPALGALPVARQALQAAGAEDPARSSNPWFQVERLASAATENSITAWRLLRDRWAEAAFDLLHACAAPYRVPDAHGMDRDDGGSHGAVHRVTASERSTAAVDGSSACA
ncbi:DUF3141 domain-containing protein [Azohydromonas caseinilytica]|uniref:DUF3141 domain-containing protein n=1 Tax=Azohydromonas caseinilytica TaxID=2728836 RepID=A0A848FF47_9BURK|nr:DUF3141 domain-containing protein [Azohydromonas caseinilytica]NML16949.1 DUF3141 domain-containing protein [Azohydromonas caseinilytica]